VPLNDFRKATVDIIRTLRHSPKAPGQSRIYTAAEKEFYNSHRVREAGMEIASGVQVFLRALGKEMDISADGLGF